MYLHEILWLLNLSSVPPTTQLLSEKRIAAFRNKNIRCTLGRRWVAFDTGRKKDWRASKWLRMTCTASSLVARAKKKDIKLVGSVTYLSLIIHSKFLYLLCFGAFLFLCDVIVCLLHDQRLPKKQSCFNLVLGLSEGWKGLSLQGIGDMKNIKFNYH